MRRLWYQIRCWWHHVCPKHCRPFEQDEDGHGECAVCRLEKRNAALRMVRELTSEKEKATA